MPTKTYQAVQFPFTEREKNSGCEEGAAIISVCQFSFRHPAFPQANERSTTPKTYGKNQMEKHT